MSDRITWTTEIRRLGELHPWDINPRQIKEAQAARLSESLDTFGQVETIAVGPDNQVYNGHQRLNVWMREHGADFEIECRVSSRELTEDERKQLTVFLHQGATGEWDFDLLANNFDVDDLLDWGFEKADLDLDLWMPEPEEDPGAEIDRAEELREKWGVNLGDLWQLGSHKLICGDCTKLKHDYNLPLFTDPPYGINHDPSWLDNAHPNRQALSSRNVLEGDDGSLDLSFLFGFERRMIWGFPYICDENATGWVVWDKQPGVEGRGIVTPVEMASTTMRTGFDMVRVMWGGYYRASGEEKHAHPTEKPLGVIEPFIADWTKPDDEIYDPFLGSGTTLIACERLQRKCRACEISPAYCAVAIERWHEMTGGEPVLVTE